MSFVFALANIEKNIQATTPKIPKVIVPGTIAAELPI